MLVRHIQESGGKIYGNKRVHGRRELRDIFIGAAESAMRTETTLRDYHDALRAKGTSAKDAKVALARKNCFTDIKFIKKQRYIQRRLRGVFKRKENDYDYLSDRKNAKESRSLDFTWK
ncbi:MAG: hypothetical protein HOP07_07870 [Bacteriovoracaceae bacterium]|nr:hypothetical protein [Bacteriovoracaceae bacterium]